jgi:putrescine aminotransferase
MAELEYAPLFWNFGNEPSARLIHRLAGLAPPGIDQVYFTNGGSESCERDQDGTFYHHLRGERQRDDPVAPPPTAE